MEKFKNSLLRTFRSPVIRLILYTFGITIILNSIRYFSFDLLFSFFTLTLILVLIIPIFIFYHYKNEDEKYLARYISVRFGLALVLSLINAFIYPINNAIDLRLHFIKVNGISVNFDQTDYETRRDFVTGDESESEVSYTSKIFNYAMDKSIALDGLTLPDGVSIVRNGNKYGIYNKFDNQYFESIYSCYDCDFELDEFLYIKEKPLTSFGMAYLEGYKILPKTINNKLGINQSDNYEYTYDKRIGFKTLGLFYLWDLLLKEFIYNIFFIFIFIYSFKIFKIKNV